MKNKMAKLKKRFVWKQGTINISLVDWDDGTPLGYMWVGTKKQLHEKPTYDFALSAGQAVTLAKAILAAAKQSGMVI